MLLLTSLTTDETDLTDLTLIFLDFEKKNQCYTKMKVVFGLS